jgi:hypothetical protein
MLVRVISFVTNLKGRGKIQDHEKTQTPNERAIPTSKSDEYHVIATNLSSGGTS